MGEVSLILKDTTSVTVEEFRILHKFATIGRFWSLVIRPTNVPYRMQYKVAEYILYPEDLTVFCIVSSNILVTWNTDKTRYLKPSEEFQLDESLFIRPLI